VLQTASGRPQGDRSAPWPTALAEELGAQRSLAADDAGRSSCRGRCDGSGQGLAEDMAAASNRRADYCGLSTESTARRSVCAVVANVALSHSGQLIVSRVLPDHGEREIPGIADIDNRQ
jgi:hypothetical protein